VDLVQRRVRKADGARALNEGLSTVVAGLWAEIEEDRDRLLVEFELVDVGAREFVLRATCPTSSTDRPCRRATWTTGSSLRGWP
jgi:hypothetical protein